MNRSSVYIIWQKAAIPVSRRFGWARDLPGDGILQPGFKMLFHG
jgi:hypothetical protein